MSDRHIAIVIDIDGTILGDISPQVIEWQMISDYNKSSMRYFKKYLIDVLRDYLIRPGLSTFLTDFKESHGNNVHFFVYTASEHKWAMFLTPCIEAALGIQFKRPIFTRNHMVFCKKSGYYKKSLGHVLPSMNKTCKTTMKLEDCVLIDNNSTLIPSESSRLILCSTFDYAFYQDPLRFLPVKKVEQNLENIIDKLYSIDNFKSIKKNISFEQFYIEYYKRIYKIMTINCNKKDSIMWNIVHSVFKSYMSKNKIKRGLKDAFVLKANDQLKKVY